MSDNIRRLRSIKKALLTLYPEQPKGNCARHLHTLAALMSGLVGSRRSNFPQMAMKVTDDRRPESRVKKFARWVANDSIETSSYYLPFAQRMLKTLIASPSPLVVIFDTSVVGRGCIALVASVLYKSRALPLAWIVRQGGKGHFPQALHLELAHRVRQLIPTDTEVIFLGDGEFGETEVIKLVKSYGWQLVCRTAKNRLLLENDQAFQPHKIGVGPDGYFCVPSVLLANDANGQQLHFVVYWKRPHHDPIYLLTNIEPALEAAWWYRKRFHIETFFSDQKSHLNEPDRLERLMIATCLAYILIVLLGVLAIQKGWHKRIHRTERCDVSLFQLGLRLIEYRLGMAKNIPFQLNLFTKSEKSVR